MRKRTYLSVVLTAVTAGLLLAWLLLLRPASLGGPVTYVMVSGQSMEPTLHGGDLAIVRKQHTYVSGDIIAFRVGKGIVIHRIVGESAEGGFATQGDNKHDADPWRPTQNEIVGNMWFHIPGGGQWLAFLRQPLPLAMLAGYFAMFIVLFPPGWHLNLPRSGRTAAVSARDRKRA